MLVLCAKHHVLPACSRGSVKCICSQVHWAGMTESREPSLTHRGSGLEEPMAGPDFEG